MPAKKRARKASGRLPATTSSTQNRRPAINAPEPLDDSPPLKTLAQPTGPTPKRTVNIPALVDAEPGRDYHEPSPGLNASPPEMPPQDNLPTTPPYVTVWSQVFFSTPPEPPNLPDQATPDTDQQPRVQLPDDETLVYPRRGPSPLAKHGTDTKLYRKTPDRLDRDLNTGNTAQSVHGARNEQQIAGLGASPKDPISRGHGTSRKRPRNTESDEGGE